jgi:hypothetical protein
MCDSWGLKGLGKQKLRQRDRVRSSGRCHPGGFRPESAVVAGLEGFDYHRDHITPRSWRDANLNGRNIRGKSGFVLSIKFNPIAEGLREKAWTSTPEVRALARTPLGMTTQR